MKISIHSSALYHVTYINIYPPNPSHNRFCRVSFTMTFQYDLQILFCGSCRRFCKLLIIDITEVFKLPSKLPLIRGLVHIPVLWWPQAQIPKRNASVRAAYCKSGPSHFEISISICILYELQLKHLSAHRISKGILKCKFPIYAIINIPGGMVPKATIIIGCLATLQTREKW